MSELSTVNLISALLPAIFGKMLTIAVCDSRGRYLDTWVDNENILVSFHSGAKLNDVAHEAPKIIPRFKPDIIVLMAGVNDLTVLDRRTRQVRLISTSRSVMIHHLITQINWAKASILALYPNIKVAIGGILGIEINTYNRMRGILYER